MDLYKVIDILEHETVQKFPSEVSSVDFRKAIHIAAYLVDEEITRRVEDNDED